MVEWPVIHSIRSLVDFNSSSALSGLIFAILLCVVLRIDFEKDSNVAYRAFISAIIVYVILYFALAITLNEYIVSSIFMLIGAILIIFAFWIKLDDEQKERLIQTQTHWLKQFELEKDFFYSFKDLQYKIGREGMFVSATNFMNKLRERTLELEEILNRLTD